VKHRRIYKRTNHCKEILCQVQGKERRDIFFPRRSRAPRRSVARPAGRFPWRPGGRMRLIRKKECRGPKAIARSPGPRAPGTIQPESPLPRPAGSPASAVGGPLHPRTKPCTRPERTGPNVKTHQKRTTKRETLGPCTTPTTAAPRVRSFL
jgi:hypothetical protein